MITRSSQDILAIIRKEMRSGTLQARAEERTGAEFARREELARRAAWTIRKRGKNRSATAKSER